MAASRGSIALLALIRLIVAALLTACVAAAQAPASSREFRYLMGTSVLVEASGGDDGTRRTATDEAFGAMAEVDRLMSNYRSDSELSRINGMAARGPVTVTDPMVSVLQAARLVSERSGGCFDVTIGPLVNLWGFHDRKPHVPTAPELAAIRPLIDFRGVILDPDRHTVRLARVGMAIDLGGIAKGFAVELAAGVLRRHGLAGTIDAGGNQYLVGLPTGKPGWTVGIKNPDSPSGLLGTIETGETSVSTSAGYSNFLTIDGRTYGHILDPRTLQPAVRALSATVLSRDGTLADAVSTAAFILGPKDGLALIDGLPDMAGIIAYRQPDGRVGLVMSPRLKSLFRRL